MPAKHPLVRYRQTEASDGEGGFAETPGAAYNFFGHIELHDNRTSLVVDEYEDIKVDDIIEVAEDGQSAAKYRVTGFDLLPGTHKKRFDLERQERPIVPV